jgi:hypothetical protein
MVLNSKKKSTSRKGKMFMERFCKLVRCRSSQLHSGRYTGFLGHGFKTGVVGWGVAPWQSHVTNVQETQCSLPSTAKKKKIKVGLLPRLGSDRGRTYTC